MNRKTKEQIKSNIKTVNENNQQTCLFPTAILHINM